MVYPCEEHRNAARYFSWGRVLDMADECPDCEVANEKP